MLVPHLQVKLMADVARWVLCGGAPDTLSLGHCAALWAAHNAFRGSLDIEGVESPYEEAPQPPKPREETHRKALSPSEGGAYMEASGKLSDLKRSAALVLADGGDLEAHGLADLPPELPLPEDYCLRRQTQAFAREAAVPRGMLGLVVSSFNPRPACQPSLLAPWNINRHAVVSAYREYVVALFRGRGGVELSVNADSCTTRDVYHMLTTCLRCIMGDAGGGSEEELLVGHCEFNQVPRLRRLKSIANKLNAAFVAALSHDPSLLSRSFTQLMALSVHGSYHTMHWSPEAMRPGCEAYARRLDAWIAADATRGIDTRKEYLTNLPSEHELSVASMEKEARGRREHLLLVASRAAEAAEQGGEERELHQCVAEYHRAREAGIGVSSPSEGSTGREGASGSGSGTTSSSSSGQMSESETLNALVVDSCVGVLGQVYREGECKSGHERSPDKLKQLRFERMLGEYHALMREEALAATLSCKAGDAGAADSPAEVDTAALERVYGSFDTRLAVAARIPHPIAPAWLEMYPPQGWVDETRDSLQDAGLRCDTCNEKKEAKDLLACSACKVARYCSSLCQRRDWSSRHKAVCAAMRRGRGS